MKSKGIRMIKKNLLIGLKTTVCILILVGKKVYDYKN